MYDTVFDFWLEYNVRPSFLNFIGDDQKIEKSLLPGEHFPSIFNFLNPVLCRFWKARPTRMTRVVVYKTTLTIESFRSVTHPEYFLHDEVTLGQSIDTLNGSLYLLFAKLLLC